MIDKTEKNHFVDSIKKEEKDILEEIKPVDPNFKVNFENTEKIKTILTEESQCKILNLIHALPHGVDKKSYDISDLVETSTNLATISFTEKNVSIHMSTRSSIKSALQDLRDRIYATADLAGAKITEEASYPGWKPNLDSNILKISKKIFNDMYGNEPKVEAIHAGLECGIIGEKYQDMDMISIGPTIKYPHSPEEQVHVSSVEKTYKFILKILEEI
jgi:dipeptidase D